MTELEINVKKLNELIINGDTIQAMRLFYAENVEMQENEEMPRKGKLLCLVHEMKNVEGVTGIKSKLLNQAINLDNNSVFSEWEFTFTSKADNRMKKLTEVSVQHWSNGRIDNEKFYYKDFIPVESL